MRWIWIDKFVEFTPKQSATAVKNVSMAEEHLHDLYPAFPIVPNSLIVEGMAQTAGILVAETITFSAKIEQLNEQGASITGTVTVAGEPVADIELMFSHVDQNMAGLEF